MHVAPRQDQIRRLSLQWANRAEDEGRCGSLVLRRRGAGAALRPPSDDLVLVTNTRLIGKPDFYGAGIDALLLRNIAQAGGRTYFKSSMASTMGRS